MLPFAYYLLKITICSAVLFGYYWFLLRNKVFHGYNRFYLLAIVGLAIILPLCRINIFAEKHTAQTSVIKMLQVVTEGDEYLDEVIIGGTKKTTFSVVNFLPFVYLMVSVVLLFLLLQMLFSIYQLIKKHTHTNIQNIHFINTEAAKGTPFSFFKFIFWNNQINLHSPEGTRIFKHELAHIQEQHSLDKMFINLVLIVFWSNPIFWLVRKELSMIHEFIADKKAVEDGDTAAFAAMILATTYPQHNITIANNFFYSPIKRRLMMLTKNKHPRTSYVSRLLVLPVLVIVFAAFTVKAKEYKKQIEERKNIINLVKQNVLDVETISLKEENKIAEKSKNGNSYELPFLSKKTITVVIDAGHGGKDNGATSKDGITEKDLNLQLVNRIKLLNKNANVKLILTRETDVFVNVHDKADFANAQNPDLFISIHLDSKGEKQELEGTGMSVFVSTDSFANSAKSKLFASAIIGTFQNNYSLKVKSNPVQRKQAVWVLRGELYKCHLC
jgi:N-acetylmuramoyl-L-alanine amidase